MIAIIPARAGSKGIKDKNIVNLNGRPLIAHTIISSLNSVFIQKTFVTTDSDEIGNVAKKWGAEVIMRSSALAEDNTSMIPVLLHALDNIDFNGSLSFILLQPTSPLRTKVHIEDAIKLYKDKSANALISVIHAEKHPYKSFKTNNKGFLTGIIDNKSPFLTRQELPKCYYPNGAIYIRNIIDFRKTNSLMGENTLPYIMNSENSIDIDDMRDLLEAEEILRSRND